MSRFTKSFTKEIEFDGDKITIKLNRLKRIDAGKLTPFFSERNEAGEVVINEESSQKILELFAEILPSYIISIRGLIIEDVEVSKESEDFNLIFEEVYFIDLVGQIGNALMENSFLKEAESEGIKKPVTAQQAG